LYQLAESITDAFDFEHAFGFYGNIKSWTDSVDDYGEEKEEEKE
jgi:hypothetical protein